PALAALAHDDGLTAGCVRRATAAVVIQAAADAITAAGIVSRPLEPTSSAANNSGEISRRVIAAMPAAVPIATDNVGDVPKRISAMDARATPMKIAGNTGPPRNPLPRLTA